MNNRFMQRLVGAIVLVCLALILWPVVFSGPGNKALDKQSQIPPRPVFDEYTVPEPDRVVGVEPVATTPATIPAAVPKQPTVEPESFPEPGLDDRQLPIAWVLQVASFSQQSNAKELMQTLQKSGYKAFTRDVGSKEDRSTRVYIGPSLNKATLDRDRQDIDKAYKVSSMIVRFEQ